MYLKCYFYIIYRFNKQHIFLINKLIIGEVLPGFTPGLMGNHGKEKDSKGSAPLIDGLDSSSKFVVA